MKLLIKYLVQILFIVLLVPISFAQNYWNRLPSPTSLILSRCSFIDTIHGWVAGDSGLIMRTDNGGENWTIQNYNEEISILDLCMLNERLGWAVTGNPLSNGWHILKTTNGGNNWSESFCPDTSVWLFTIYFIDTLTGFLGGNHAYIMKTTNAGQNWFRCSVDSNDFNFFPVLKFAFISPQTGVACGGFQDHGGSVWRTTDFGNNWAICDSVFECIWDIAYRDSASIAGCGSDFEIGGPFMVKSTNGGMNWVFKYLESMPLGLCKTFAYRTPNNIWMSLGFALSWAVSYDNGTIWELIPVADSLEITDIQFVNERNGWSVGTGGVIYKYNPSAIGIMRISHEVPQQFYLFQNFPNPFNPSTKIKFSIPTPLHPPFGQRGRA